jgi:hypothetical protein
MQPSWTTYLPTSLLISAALAESAKIVGTSETVSNTGKGPFTVQDLPEVAGSELTCYAQESDESNQIVAKIIKDIKTAPSELYFGLKNSAYTYPDNLKLLKYRGNFQGNQGLLYCMLDGDNDEENEVLEEHKGSALSTPGKPSGKFDEAKVTLLNVPAWPKWHKCSVGQRESTKSKTTELFVSCVVN